MTASLKATFNRTAETMQCGKMIVPTPGGRVGILAIALRDAGAPDLPITVYADGRPILIAKSVSVAAAEHERRLKCKSE
jgi:hypothetical protein